VRHRVLLVEDDDETRARIAGAIQAEPRLVLAGVAATCAEARAVLSVSPPDVLVTDLSLPDGHGTELIREARAARPRTEALVITVFGDERSVVAALEAGAAGYLLKDGTDAELARPILQLVDGGSPISPAIARHLLRHFQRETGAPESARPLDGSPALSVREREVLELLARGFRVGEIAERLGISAHTVTTHVRHLYGKLEVRSRGEAVYAAMRRGLLPGE
jgi:DNA-binding NarL/FixJ family response regulator